MDDEIALIEEAAALAEKWLSDIRNCESKRELCDAREMSHLVQDEEGKKFIFRLLDQAFRSKRASRIQNQIAFLLGAMKVPAFFPRWQKALLWVFRIGSRFAPSLAVEAVKKVIQQKAKKWVFDADPLSLRRHIEKRKKEGIAINVNYLGEAIIGEEEAKRRHLRYVEYIRRPEIEIISIKISSLYSQQGLVAFEASCTILKEKFRCLLREVKEHPRPDGKYKCINFDMEEYRDLQMTCTVFRETLEEPEFFGIEAGIALQAYLPDSYTVASELLAWARMRRSRGGAPIKIRLVKGANLAIEKIEASLRGWKEAPYRDKTSTDRNFIRMAKLFLSEENHACVTLGIASHNLFDLAWIYLVAKKRGYEKEIIFEMLEGMVPSLVRILQSHSLQILLYCPVVDKKDFESAIAYLFRRFDESSGKENFLTHFFSMQPGDVEWKREKERFFASFIEETPLQSTPERDQNRFQLLFPANSHFVNEPDTDFSLIQNRLWAQKIYAHLRHSHYGNIPQIIAGKVVSGDIEDTHPISPHFSLRNGSLSQIEAAISTAAMRGKKKRSCEENVRLLKNCSRLMRERRGQLISAMIINTFKTLVEADSEVSEAIDFIDYYAESYLELYDIAKGKIASVGPVVVASPWNFPLSIPCGGISSSLAAQNPTIFKPAQEAILVGYLLAQIFWDGGFDREELQFVYCADEPEASLLVQDPSIERIILTGGTATAKKLQALQGEKAKLMGETGGKNGFILTAISDHDQAIRDLLLSAFSNCGQKCSACSLLLLERELYDDVHFLEKLKDAAESLICEEPGHPESFVNPLIAPPLGALLRALTELEEGESWLLRPNIDSQDPRKVTPGIKLGVKKGSFTATTEFFGPLLGVIPFTTLDEAIDIVNSSSYGLTSGIHSLDSREIARWIDRIEAGNLYINRTIVGAIVKRQPFGGAKESQYGFGFKAGGQNALLPLVNLAFSSDEDDYEEAYTAYFSGKRKTCDLLGQENLFWVVPKKKIFFRIMKEDASLEIDRVKKAALIVGTPLELCFEEEESDEEFLSRLHTIDRPYVRILQDSKKKLVGELNRKGATLLLGRAHHLGRFELPRYFREVALSVQTHRYGFIDSQALFAIEEI